MRGNGFLDRNDTPITTSSLGCVVWQLIPRSHGRGECRPSIHSLDAFLYFCFLVDNKNNWDVLELRIFFRFFATAVERIRSLHEAGLLAVSF